MILRPCSPPNLSMACDLLDLAPDEARAAVAEGRRPWAQPHCSACRLAAWLYGLPVRACIQTHLADSPRPCDGCIANGLL